ncbi:MAG: 30S ribosomal protein S20 [Thermoguttaceae bacterium]|nr:30S ribosomal protein S20 [Thermoguttaceae bacterium]
MPNIKSAKKRQRQNVVLRERNRSARSLVRNRIKKLIRTLKEGNVEEAENQFRGVYSALDRAAAKNIWHSNTTSRKKSRLSKLILKTKQGG